MLRLNVKCKYVSEIKFKSVDDDKSIHLVCYEGIFTFFFFLPTKLIFHYTTYLK